MQIISALILFALGLLSAVISGDGTAFIMLCMFSAALLVDFWENIKEMRKK